MESKELRIGNYLQNRNGIPYKVLGEMFVDGFHGLKPIPLTEELLLRIGFSVSSLGDDNVVSVNGFYLWKDRLQHITTGTRIKHVHQLQNLYFALTGEELEII